MKEYVDGYKLKEDEFLLKVKQGEPRTKWVGSDRIEDGVYPDRGFLTKFNKSGSMPVAFKQWPNRYGSGEELPIKVVKEVFKSGWKLSGWRFGMSQNWASLLHPNGYTIEIYLDQFLDIVQEFTIEKGEIIGEFKWEDHKLIKR